jgi:hypothetical protein
MKGLWFGSGSTEIVTVSLLMIAVSKLGIEGVVLPNCALVGRAENIDRKRIKNI